LKFHGKEPAVNGSSARSATTRTARRTEEQPVQSQLRHLLHCSLQPVLHRFCCRFPAESETMLESWLQGWPEITSGHTALQPAL
jgi:hypothetical protein